MVTLAKAKVIYVPSITIFEHISREAYYREFFQDETDSVVVPLIESAGYFFPHTLGEIQKEGDAISEHGSTFSETINLFDVVNFFSSKGVKIYLSLELSMPQLAWHSNACCIVDQAGNRSGHCCVNNPLTQGYLTDVIENPLRRLSDTLGEALVGFTLSAKNFWPMSALSGRFLVTCFCSTCISSLQNYNKSLQPSVFSAYPSCINLALSEVIYRDEDGDEFGSISNVSKITRDMQPDEVLHVCSQTRGTLAAAAFDDGSFERKATEFNKKANQLLIFTQARSQLTISACHQLFNMLLSFAPNRKKILISEGRDYDWAAGLFLTDLGPAVCDEAWLPPTDRIPDGLSTIVPILSNRAAYYIDAFFDLSATLRDPNRVAAYFSTMSPRKVEKSLKRYQNEAGSDVYGLNETVLPDYFAERPGSVAIGMNKHLLERVANSALEEYASIQL